jgi:proteasome regulatory subunit
MQSPTDGSSNTTRNKKKAIKKSAATSFMASTSIQPSIEVPKIKFADMGGISEQFLEVLHLAMHMKRPEIHEQLNVQPPSGCLIHGPPGCGN